MVFKATFNKILVISRWSDLLVEDTGVPGENQRPVACQTSSHNVVSSTPRRIRTHSVSGYRTDSIGSCKSKYHATTTTMVLSNSAHDWLTHANIFHLIKRGRHGHNRMVGGLTTTYAISAYHH
jgi:hypothetical protein